LALKDLSAAIGDYLTFRGRLRAGERLTSVEQEEYENLVELLDLFISRKAGEPPLVSVTRRKGRRSSIRVPVEVRAVLKSASDLRECMALNLSEGGVFLATDDILPLGTETDLVLELAEEKTEVSVSGIMQWQCSGNDDPLPEGIGILFTDLDDKQSAALRRFIDGETEALVELM